MITVTPQLAALLPETVYVTPVVVHYQHVRAFHLAADCRATGRRPESKPLRVALDRELGLCLWCAKKMIASLAARTLSPDPEA